MSPEFSEHADWFLTHIKPHESMLRSWLKSRFSGSCEIDDVIQESYLRVLKARQRHELKSPKAFLFATARNLALDIVRHSNIIRFESFTENDLSGVLNSDEDVQEAVSRNQELELLTKAIQSLPIKCRRIFTLRRVYCLSQAEISEKLGISVNTVATQLKIGIKKCAVYMEEHCDR